MGENSTTQIDSVNMIFFNFSYKCSDNGIYVFVCADVEILEIFCSDDLQMQQ